MSNEDIKSEARYTARLAFLSVLDMVEEGLNTLKLEEFSEEAGEFIEAFWKQFFEECE